VKIPAAAAYVLCAASAVFLARLELHSDDAGVIAFFILACAGVLGFLHPRHAWQWALLVGPSVPIADLIFRAGRAPVNSVAGVGLLLLFVIAVGLAGSYSGALLRSGVARLVGERK